MYLVFNKISLSVIKNNVHIFIQSKNSLDGYISLLLDDYFYSFIFLNFLYFILMFFEVNRGKYLTLHVFLIRI